MLNLRKKLILIIVLVIMDTTPEDEGIDDFFFDDGRGYHIKDDAPEEAKQSYIDFYAEDPDFPGIHFH